jgi:putative SOS response-associated peptidase YedK
MCGRFAQALPAEMLVRMFGALDLRQVISRPSWNVAPSAQVTVAVWDARREIRVLVPMTWGLLAPWEKHWDTARLRPINARCETVATSRMFAPAFRRRRCLVAVDGWYEWAREGGQKLPHGCGCADRRATVLGGIWESWTSPIGDQIRTLALVTTPASPDLAAIHDRMPLVLEEADWPVWLGESKGNAAALMRPAARGSVMAWRVSRAVSNPDNNGAELLAPLS